MPLPAAPADSHKQIRKAMEVSQKNKGKGKNAKKKTGDMKDDRNRK